MPGRTYTDEQRTEALDLYVQHGACEAARRTGIKQTTISSWATRAGIRSNATENTQVQAEALAARHAIDRAEIQSELLARARRMLDRMVEPEIDYRGNTARQVRFDEASPVSCKAFATAAAILIDKFRLEMGEATDRTEHQAIPERTPEHEAEMGKVIDMLAERRAS